ncbi:MAG: ATP-binding protein [Gemmataceae bacterium]
MSDAPPLAVLVVDDDPDSRANLRDILELDGYAVEEAGSVAEALARSEWGRYVAVVLDRQLPDGTADDLLPHLRRLAPDAAVVVVTGFADVRGAVAAFRLGAADYVLKPVNPDELRTRLGRLAEARRYREALRESQEFARAVLDSLTAHIAVLDQTGAVVAVNAAWDEFARLRHGDPARCGVGANYLDVCTRATGAFAEEAPAVAAGIRDVLAGVRSRFALEYPCDFLDEKLWFSMIVTPLGPDRRGVVVSHLDISDRKRAEVDLRAKSEELRATTQQLWQAARLAGVGELAASLAHELNNPLATVHLRVEGLLAKTPAGDPRRRLLEVVDQEVTRMASLVGNLLGFSRAGRDQVSTVDVCEEVARTAELTDHHLRKRRIRFHPEFAPGTPIIHADRQQLRQVFLNLFTNAADAMPNGGRLTARVGPGELPGTRPAVAVDVTDTGVGIPAEHLPRVLESFFTTKEEGKGTGLGLAICRRIVEQHNGRLEIDSRVGEGTTVRVTLPVRPDTNVVGLHAE